ncbi:hypothetical protein [Dactylosporangium sp. CA-139066]|uniref:hypothetical protein n=1 Tax=Dactylosporangium sp. CA-139066 TaxID=3239930 RepID=UPI003D8ABD50
MPDPALLRALADRWEALAVQMHGLASEVVSAVAGTNWSGEAKNSAVGTSELVADSVRAAGDNAQQMADGLRDFAGKVDEMLKQQKAAAYAFIIGWIIDVATLGLASLFSGLIEALASLLTRVISALGVELASVEMLAGFAANALVWGGIAAGTSIVSQLAGEGIAGEHLHIDPLSVGIAGLMGGLVAGGFSTKFGRGGKDVTTLPHNEEAGGLPALGGDHSPLPKPGNDVDPGGAPGNGLHLGGPPAVEPGTVTPVRASDATVVDSVRTPRPTSSVPHDVPGLNGDRVEVPGGVRPADAVSVPGGRGNDPARTVDPVRAGTTVEPTALPNSRTSVVNRPPTLDEVTVSKSQFAGEPPLSSSAVRPVNLAAEGPHPSRTNLDAGGPPAVRTPTSVSNDVSSVRAPGSAGGEPPSVVDRVGSGSGGMRLGGSEPVPGKPVVRASGGAEGSEVRVSAGGEPPSVVDRVGSGSGGMRLGGSEPVPGKPVVRASGGAEGSEVRVSAGGEPPSVVDRVGSGSGGMRLGGSEPVPGKPVVRASGGAEGSEVRVSAGGEPPSVVDRVGSGSGGMRLGGSEPVPGKPVVRASGGAEGSEVRVSAGGEPPSVVDRVGSGSGGMRLGGSEPVPGKPVVRASGGADGSEVRVSAGDGPPSTADRSVSGSGTGSGRQLLRYDSSGNADLVTLAKEYAWPQNGKTLGGSGTDGPPVRAAGAANKTPASVPNPLRDAAPGDGPAVSAKSDLATDRYTYVELRSDGTMVPGKLSPNDVVVEVRAASGKYPGDSASGRGRIGAREPGERIVTYNPQGKQWEVTGVSSAGDRAAAGSAGIGRPGRNEPVPSSAGDGPREQWLQRNPNGDINLVTFDRPPVREPAPAEGGGVEFHRLDGSGGGWQSIRLSGARPTVEPVHTATPARPQDRADIPADREPKRVLVRDPQSQEWRVVKQSAPDSPSGQGGARPAAGEPDAAPSYYRYNGRTNQLEPVPVKSGRGLDTVEVHLDSGKVEVGEFHPTGGGKPDLRLRSDGALEGPETSTVRPGDLSYDAVAGEIRMTKGGFSSGDGGGGEGGSSGGGRPGAGRSGGGTSVKPASRGSHTQLAKDDDVVFRRSPKPRTEPGNATDGPPVVQRLETVLEEPGSFPGQGRVLDEGGHHRPQAGSASGPVSASDAAKGSRTISYTQEGRPVLGRPAGSLPQPPPRNPTTQEPAAPAAPHDEVLAASAQADAHRRTEPADLWAQRQNAGRNETLWPSQQVANDVARQDDLVQLRQGLGAGLDITVHGDAIVLHPRDVQPAPVSRPIGYTTVVVDGVTDIAAVRGLITALPPDRIDGLRVEYPAAQQIGGAAATDLANRILTAIPGNARLNLRPDQLEQRFPQSRHLVPVDDAGQVTFPEFATHYDVYPPDRPAPRDTPFDLAPGDEPGTFRLGDGWEAAQTVAGLHFRPVGAEAPPVGGRAGNTPRVVVGVPGVEPPPAVRAQIDQLLQQLTDGVEIVEHGPATRLVQPAAGPDEGHQEALGPAEHRPQPAPIVRHDATVSLDGTGTTPVAGAGSVVGPSPVLSAGSVLPSTVGGPDALSEAQQRALDGLVGWDVEPSWPLFLPSGAGLLSTMDSGGVSGEVVVVGSGAGEPVGVLSAVQRAAGGVDQPVVVVSVPPGGSPDAGQVAAVRTLLNVYGWRGRVPVVVTRGRLTALESLLDLYGVSAVYQTSAAGAGLGGPSGGLAALNLSNSWVLRRPAGEPEAAGLSSEVLSAELLQAAAGRRRPVFDRPSTPVASFLSVPLHDTSRIRETYDTYRALLARDLPQVQQIVSRDPAFAGHQAVLGLAELGQFDAAVAYLQAGDDRPDVIAAPLLNIDRDATPVQRERAVVGMLPHLAALARAVSHDLASEAILLAVADLITENRSQEDVKNDIWFHKNLLPKDGRLRVGWVTHLTQLTQQLPEHNDSLGWIASAIMNCPD